MDEADVKVEDQMFMQLCNEWITLNKRNYKPKQRLGKSTILHSSALRGNDLAALGYLRITACKIDRLVKSESVKTVSHVAQVKNQHFFLKKRLL